MSVVRSAVRVGLSQTAMEERSFVRAEIYFVAARGPRLGDLNRALFGLESNRLSIGSNKSENGNT